MRFRPILACVGVAVALIATFGFRQADQSTPENTISGLIKAFEAGDMKAAASFVKGGKTDGDFKVFEEMLKQEAPKLTFSDLKVDVKGDKASASLKLTFSAKNQPAPQTIDDSVDLVQESGRWLIVPPTGIPSGPSIVASLAYALTHPEMLQHAKGAAQTTSCLSNMKQVCLSVIMFATDNDDILKLKADAWKAKVMPYCKNEGIFHCPQDTTKGVSYSLNPNLAGKSMTAIKKPAQTVLVYEGKKMKLDFRHEGKACVGFADGHVKLFTPEEAKVLRWKP